MNDLIEKNFNIRNGNDNEDLYFLDDKGTPICLLINPLIPTMNEAQFIEEIIEIQNNKVLQF
jgi:hypothetical protein